jgi:hypothetical protein
MTTGEALEERGKHEEWGNVEWSTGLANDKIAPPHNACGGVEFVESLPANMPLNYMMQKVLRIKSVKVLFFGVVIRKPMICNPFATIFLSSNNF